MKTLKFKSTIKCTGCLANVTPYLNKAEGIEIWDVDLKNPEKVLTVQGQGLSEENVKKAVEKAGYSVEAIH
jgi:copper chaperone